MRLVDDLMTVEEREDGGRTAIERFDFQTAWGISKVLKLHTADLNYAVAFEFHDDVVSLDDADAPTKAVFYQIKTQQAGNWSIASVVYRPMGTGKQPKPKASIAGKMFGNLKRFGDGAEKLVLVSNQPMTETGTKNGEVSFAAATPENIAKFVTALKLEIKSFKDEHVSFFNFDYCELNLASFESAVIGQVSVFLRDHSTAESASVPFTAHLVNEGKRRSKRLANLKSFGELKASKFMTRADMDKWLGALDNVYLYRPNWETTSRQLALPHSQDARLEREWNNYMAERKRRWSAGTLEFATKIKENVTPIIDTSPTLAEGLEACVPSVRDQVRAWKPGATDDYVKAAILYEYKR
ncbi:DUF4297 domain-containing protein [Shinella kummerowiae]|uniref:DUF4297 domain-containing protein n=1 Tax=Shinella kummerowiae TaxID=417745 RepID=A0A6N8S535_9HYPH|nr:DUF4297 domain-containing protein [Shinella kummerowiae]